jgi:ABC-2 type transport system ATP-binding protein
VTDTSLLQAEELSERIVSVATAPSGTPTVTRERGESMHVNQHVLLEGREAEAAVSVKGISKTFKKQKKQKKIFSRKPVEPVKVVKALDDMTFEVKRNEIFGILGANGSGKSTLIRLMSTLLITDEGEIKIFGYDVRNDEAEVKRLINRVSVEASFFKKLSAIENLLYSTRLYGGHGKNLRPQITEILVRLGIPRDRVGTPLEQMSRGMQQKVAIARAFLTAPVLLLLDEPTTGLDPRSKKDVQKFVLELRDTHDATVIICSHDMDEAERLCDRIAVVDNGRLVAIGTADELKRLVAERDGILNPTMEDTFIALTGHEINDDGNVVEAA